MAYVEDRWYQTGRGGSREKTARYGTGRRWRVRYLDPDGKERSKSFARKADADKFMVSTAARVLEGTWTDPGAGKITLRAYATEWQRRQVTDLSTQEAADQRLRVHVLPKLGDRTLAELAARPGLIQAWVAGLPLAPSYVRVVLGTLSAVLTAAVADGLIPRNPCQAASVRRPRVAARRVQPWTAEQVAAVREALPGRYQAVVDLGEGLGLRQGEMFGLSPDDIDWLRPAGAVVHVRRQVRLIGGKLTFGPAKGGKERDVPLAEPVKLALAAHIAAYPPAEVTLPWGGPGGKPVKEKLLITTSASQAVGKNGFNRTAWRPALVKTGITPSRQTGCHALRHYYASVLLHGGCDIKALSEYLGHHSAAFTLATYVHLMPAADDRARAAISAAWTGTADGPATAQGGVQ